MIALLFNPFSLAAILSIIVWFTKPPLARLVVGIIGCLIFVPDVALAFWGGSVLAAIGPALPLSVAVFAARDGSSRLKREKQFLVAAIAASREEGKIDAAYLCRRFDLAAARGALVLARARQRREIAADTQLL